MTDALRDNVLHRPPRGYPSPVPAEPLKLAAPPTRTQTHQNSLLYVLFPIVGSVGIFAFALVYRNKVFIYVAIAMVVTTVLFGLAVRWSQRRSGKRSARHQRRRYREYLAAREAELQEDAGAQRAAAERLYPDPRRLWAQVLRREHLWERRPDDPDFLSVRAGVGAVAHCRAPHLDLGFNPLAEHEPQLVEEARGVVARWERLDALPVLLSLRDTPVVSVVGPPDRARAWVRAAVGQLVAGRAPRDLRLLVSRASPDDGSEWAWAKWLPHARVQGDDGDAGGAVAAAIAASPEELGELLDALVAPRLERLRTLETTRVGLDDVVLDVPELVLVLDGFSPLDARARLPLLREALGNGARLRVRTLIVVADADREPPEVAARVRVAGRGTASLELTGPGGERQDIEPDGVAIGSAEALARSLAPVRLRTLAAAGALDPSQGLLPLLGLPSAASIDPDREWSGRPRALALRATLGVSSTGARVELDLKQPAEGGMGPHGLVIGATGSGKSELLRTLVAGLALAHSPEELAFVFVDFKGGAALADFGRLPHTAGTITNLGADLRLIDRMRDALYGEQERRQQLLHDAGNVEDVIAYRRLRQDDPSLPPLPDLLVLIDEFGELISSRPEFVDLVVTIGRLGRSLGIHLLFSSQRLDEGKLRGLESHLRYRICLRTNTALESKTILGTPDAHLLPSEPGLGYLKVDTGIYERFKVALVESAPDRGRGAHRRVRRFDGTGAAERAPTARRPPGGASELRAVIDRLAGSGHPPVHRIWHPPLPIAFGLDELDGGAPWWEREGARPLGVTLGLIDRPREQRAEPLRLDLSATSGHVAVVGAPRSGKSTLLRTFVLSLAREHAPDEVQVHGIDLGGGGLRALRALPHVGSIAGPADRDLARRIVRHLAAEVGRREVDFARLGLDSMADARLARANGSLEASLPDLVLVVDGWASLRRDFEGLDFEVEALLGTGLTFGIHVVVAANRWGEMRPGVADNLGGRLELRLNDPGESRQVRSRAQALPEGIPGRGLVGEGEEWQAALPRFAEVEGDDLASGLAAAVEAVAARWSAPGARPVEVLPRTLPHTALAPAGPGGLAIGVEETALAPVRLDLDGADPHLLVLGDAESGRTNFLRLVAELIDLQRGPEQARLLVVDPRRTLEELDELEAVAERAVTPAEIERLATGLAAEVAQRMAAVGAGRPVEGLPTYVLVDDYDLLVAPSGSPLVALLPALAHGRDALVHVVLARRAAGASRAVFEPVYSRLAELRTPGIILSGDRSEGPILDGVRAAPQPPGRGLLVRRRGGAPQLIQTALAGGATRTNDHLVGKGAS